MTSIELKEFNAMKTAETKRVTDALGPQVAGTPDPKNYPVQKTLTTTVRVNDRLQDADPPRGVALVGAEGDTNPPSLTEKERVLVNLTRQARLALTCAVASGLLTRATGAWTPEGLADKTRQLVDALMEVL